MSRRDGLRTHGVVFAEGLPKELAHRGRSLAPSTTMGRGHLLDQLLLFFDQLGLEDRHRWTWEHREVENTLRTQNSANPRKFVLEWRRDSRPQSWWLQRDDQTNWTAYDADSLIKALPSLGIAQATLVRHLSATILTQAAFADIVLERTCELFGTEAVKASLQQSRQFLLKLAQVAEKGPEAKDADYAPTTGLRIVK